jgi:hypothetical protein
MAHANTTLNFQEALALYPCENMVFCDAIGGPCAYQQDKSLCPERQHILNYTVKMCDSGIFTREGATLTYDDLFKAYERMAVDYGVMIDVFRDAQATIESAKLAKEAYDFFKDKFKLVVVAQGKTVEEYLECYDKLKQMGFEYIAVGGLLRKLEGTVRYAQVRDEDVLYKVLSRLREKYPSDWLFALGCFHPSRQKEFQRLNVWGDYKGWIFQYEKRNQTLKAEIVELASNHLAHENLPEEAEEQISVIQGIILERDEIVKTQKQLDRQLNAGRRTLRMALEDLHQKLRNRHSKLSSEFAHVTTHGLPKPQDEKLVHAAIVELGLQDSHEAQLVRDNISANRELRSGLNACEADLDGVNLLLATEITKLTELNCPLPIRIRDTIGRIASVVESHEQSYRLTQVRETIATQVLANSQG